MIRSLLLIWLVFSLFTVAHAGVYRWVDENGKVHFGDRPPRQVTADQVEIKQQAPGPAPAAVPADRKDKQRRLLEMYEYERQRKAQAKQKADRAEYERARNCKQAKRLWRRYTTAGALYDEDKQGNRRFLDKAERRQQEQQARSAVKRYCGEDPLRVKSETR